MNLDCMNLRCCQSPSTQFDSQVLTYSRKIGRRPKTTNVHSIYAANAINHDTYRFPQRLARVRLLLQPLHLQPPRKVPGVAEEKRPSIQMRLDQRKQVRFHRMRRVLNRHVRIERHDLKLVCVEDIVRAYSSKPLAVGDKDEVFRCQLIWGKSEAPHRQHAFRCHAHKVREINPTIPWIALPYRIAPFGGGVPGAICDNCKRTRSTENASRRTVDNDIAGSPVHRQRWRRGWLGWRECVRVIVDVPRTEISEIWTGAKAERRIQVEVLEQRLQFLGGGHCLRLSV